MNRNVVPADQFTSRRACELSGLSPTMLDYLIRERFISASASKARGRGRARLFTFGDIVTLKVIRHMLRSGIEIRKLAGGLRKFRAKTRKTTFTNLPYRFLVTDGTDIFLEEDGKLESLTQDGQLAFLFLVDLKQCADGIPTNGNSTLAA